MSAALDRKKQLPALYRASSSDFDEIEVPELTFLGIDGHGDPSGAAYETAVAALYAAAYAVRAALKARTGAAFVVGPLEGLWSSAEPGSFVAGERARWEWTMLLPLPDEAQADVAEGLAMAVRKKPELPVGEVRKLTIAEGRCLQILHVGPYAAEAPTLARLHHEVMPARGLTWNGPHHEIYLGDPRRSAPDKLKTLLRQPVRPV